MSSKPSTSSDADTGAAPHSGARKGHSIIKRGNYNVNHVSKAVFIVGRALDPVLQYAILAHGFGTPVLHRLGLRTLPAGLPSQTGISVIDSLHLSPYRLVLLAMATGAMVKQNFWIAALMREHMSVQSSCTVAAFNCAMTSIGTYTFLVSASSASTESTFPQPALIAGGVLFTTGILVELVSEIQRHFFKRDPNNKGKVYKGGLFGLARHINYGGYTVWRTGYAIACGGWVLGGIIASFFFYNFHSASLPEIDEYCSDKYGEEWNKYKKETTWKMFPFIY